MRITYLPSVDQNRASSRYRQIIPGQELEKLGHTVYYVNARRNSEWVIINKALGDEHRDSKWTGFGKVCFDMCDNHFITEHAEKHIELCEYSDLITCSTPAMRGVIFEHTGKSAKVIPDPYELDMIDPVNVNEIKTIFWHGNNSSVKPLEKIADDFGYQTIASISSGTEIKDINFSNISNWHIMIDGIDYQLNAVGANKYPWSYPYSMDATLRELEQSDVCIIPTENDDWYKCKSPNRLMNAVARGKFVIANHMPAYEPFKEWMYIGDIAKGLQWVKENLNELPDRITAAQKYVIQNHSRKVIGDRWEEVLSN